MLCVTSGCVQMRKLVCEGCEYKMVHQELISDLLLLSTSTYSQVATHTYTHAHTNPYVATSVYSPSLCVCASLRVCVCRCVAGPRLCLWLRWEPSLSPTEMWLPEFSNCSLHNTPQRHSSSSRYKTRTYTYTSGHFLKTAREAQLPLTFQKNHGQIFTIVLTF